MASTPQIYFLTVLEDEISKISVMFLVRARFLACRGLPFQNVLTGWTEIYLWCLSSITRTPVLWEPHPIPHLTSISSLKALSPTQSQGGIRASTYKFEAREHNSKASNIRKYRLLTNTQNILLIVVLLTAIYLVSKALSHSKLSRHPGFTDQGTI